VLESGNLARLDWLVRVEVSSTVVFAPHIKSMPKRGWDRWERKHGGGAGHRNGGAQGCVLIVEDEDNARKGYEQLLQRWGCDVVGVGRRKKHWQNSRVTSRTR